MSVEGKKVALTGTFRTMKRSEAGSKLANLGAMVFANVTKQVELLIAGEKAGSKLEKAKKYGIEIRDEAWLTALLAGELSAEAASVTPESVAAESSAAPGPQANAAVSFQGKKVALTGTFRTMKRSEAGSKLANLGAMVFANVTKQVELLIAGEKAGSKLEKAKKYGIEIRDEAWLTAVLAGDLSEGGVSEDAVPDDASAPVVEEVAADSAGAQERGAMEGPLSDYMTRLDALVDRLTVDPRVQVGYVRQPPISEAALARIESAWKCELSPAIKNLYRQANGFVFYWAATQDEDYRNALKSQHYWNHIKCVNPGVRYEERAPTTHEIESFPTFGAHGFVCLLPLHKALVRKQGFINYAQGSVDPEEQRELYGRSWKGEALEASIRIFEYGVGGYYPVGFLMEQGQGEPLVLVGDDHGACWTDALPVDFETYMENVLATYAQTSGRRRLLAGSERRSLERGPRLSQVDFEGLLPESETLKPREDGATFEISVLEAAEASGLELRTKLLLAKYKAYLNDIGKVLGQKAPSKMERGELAHFIAEQTADMKALDAKMAKGIARALFLPKKTKGAVAEAMFTQLSGGAVAQLEVHAVFDPSTLSTTELDYSFNRVGAMLQGQLEVRSERVISKRFQTVDGKKRRVGVVEVVLGALPEHQVMRSTLVPSGFQETPSGIYRKG